MTLMPSRTFIQTLLLGTSLFACSQFQYRSPSARAASGSSTFAEATGAPTPAASSDSGPTLKPSSTKSATIRRPFENIAATLGFGYDTRTGDFKQPCVRYDPNDLQTKTSSSDDRPGEFSTQTFEEVSTYASVSQKLNLGFSATMRYLAVSGSAGANVAEDMNINQYSSTALLHLYLEKSWRFLKVASALDDKIVQLAQTNPTAFRERCGDAFVYAVADGGELVATVNASGSSNSSQKTIQTNFSAGYKAVVVGGSVSAFFDKAEITSSAVAKISIKAWTAGGQSSYLSKDSLQKAANEFFTNARSHPVIVKLQTLGYDQVRDLVEVANDSDPTTIGSCVLQVREYVNALAYIHENPNQFTMLKAADIRNELDRAKETLAFVQQRVGANTTQWSGLCPTLPKLPERTEEVAVDIRHCGWNHLTFLADGDWAMLRLGTWCQESNPNSCPTPFRPGQNDSFRCAEGQRTLRVQEAHIQGPCTVETMIGDNKCSDNSTSNLFRAAFGANITPVNWAEYRTKLRLTPSAGAEN